MNDDGSRQIDYMNLIGYTKLQFTYDSAGTNIALVAGLNNGSNTASLYSSGLTLDDVGRSVTLGNGTDRFQLDARTDCNIDVTNAPNAVLTFGLGDGSQTVNGFATSGGGVDVLAFSTDIFADWAHLLGASSQVGSDLQITLDPNDTILLKNVALASFTSANAHFV